MSTPVRSGRRAGRAWRVGGALVVVVATGAVVLGGTRLEPGPRPGVDGTAVDVPPAPAVAVCPGPLIVPQTAGSGQFDPNPVDPVTQVAVVAAPSQGAPVAGALRALADGQVLAGLTPGDAAATLTGTSAPVVARVEAADEPARLGGTTVALVTAGDLRGLAAATCTSPTGDAWLVGGSTTVGSTADLVLVNPGSTTAEVTLEVWGPSGPVELAAPRQLVPPGASTVVGLGGLAPDQGALTVHVLAAGGQVTAYLQDGAVRGFTPAGVELVVPGAPPARRQTIPGAVVEQTTADSPDAPVLRLLAPSAATTARVTLLGPDGPVDLPGASTVDLAPGTVTDLPLGGLPAGAYTALVDADEPVVAAVEVSRVGLPGDLDPEPRVERAWVASTATGGGLAVPAPGTVTTLVVGAVPTAGASGAFTGTLRVLGPGGAVLEEHRLTIDAASTGAWPLADVVDDPATVTGVQLVAGDGEVQASWALVAERAQDDGGLVSVLLPAPEPVGSSRVAVREDPGLGVG